MVDFLENFKDLLQQTFEFFTPDFSLPITNTQEKFQERWISLNCWNSSLVALKFGVDSVSRCLESFVANVDDSTFSADHIFVWNCGLVFEGVDLEKQFKTSSKSS